MGQPSPVKPPSGLQRQVRFVSADGLPQTKRRRIMVACRTCRRRKIRCSGEQPACKTCWDFNLTCLGYDTPNSGPSSDKPNVSQGPVPAAREPRPIDTTNTTRETDSGDVLIDKQDGAYRFPLSTEAECPPGEPEQTEHQQMRPLKQQERQNQEKLLYQQAQQLYGQEKYQKQIQYQRLKGQEEQEKLHSKQQHQQKQQQEEQQSPQQEKERLEKPNSPNHSLLVPNPRTHVPYFRYFGPTAIVPGFKQMVVRVREPSKNIPSSSSDSIPSAPRVNFKESKPLVDSDKIPFYEPEDNRPVSHLICHLCDVFFTHLVCNFPFLQHDRFFRDLHQKQVQPILVDSICALAARFSLHPLLQCSNAEDPNGDTKRSHQGQPFARRAMSAMVDALSCPTLSVVQSCLLLAYEEFGSNRDSGLWMYLGIAIRMGQDLGLEKVQGMDYPYGRAGLIPRNVRSGHASKAVGDEAPGLKTCDGIERAKQRERVDTLWCIFFLDRVISSGTGRPVTLRDEDIELAFPLHTESWLSNGWPSPFPSLIRIIHLYGRITDLLNAITEENHVTPEMVKHLADMESDLTAIYQNLSPKLHFDALNFQTYVRSGEGTNFILLHFWFHTLIVLLHQPTLLHSFGGHMQQLFPNSRELAMSSAKTIADILAFAELIDAKSFIGNPFTTQPIYISACVFLMESAFYSGPAPNSAPKGVSPAQTVKSDRKLALLAAAAKDNYHKCYKALKSIEVYWRGTKYILTVLDQKAEGIGDPLLYTEEEMDSAYPMPQVPSAWVRGSTDENMAKDTRNYQPSNSMDSSQAIGWALTGATNSAQPNVSFLYQLPKGDNVDYSLPMQGPHVNPYPNIYPPNSLTSPTNDCSDSIAFSQMQPDIPSLTSQPGYLVDCPTYQRQSAYSTTATTNTASTPTSAYSNYLSLPAVSHDLSTIAPHYVPDPSGTGTSEFVNPGIIQIGARDVDVNALHTSSHGGNSNNSNINSNNTLPWAFNTEFIPWLGLEYLPSDVLSYFAGGVGDDDPQSAAQAQAENHVRIQAQVQAQIQAQVQAKAQSQARTQTPQIFDNHGSGHARGWGTSTGYGQTLPYRHDLHTLHLRPKAQSQPQPHSQHQRDNDPERSHGRSS